MGQQIKKAIEEYLYKEELLKNLFKQNKDREVVVYGYALVEGVN